jgi:hypothetical protein
MCFFHFRERKNRSDLCFQFAVVAQTQASMPVHWLRAMVAVVTTPVVRLRSRIWGRARTNFSCHNARSGSTNLPPEDLHEMAKAHLPRGIAIAEPMHPENLLG